MLRTSFLMLAASLSAALPASAAEARRWRPHHPVHHYGRFVDTSTAEQRDRAEHLDPGGVYRGYPAWARIGFSQGNNSFRR